MLKGNHAARLDAITSALEEWDWDDKGSYMLTKEDGKAILSLLEIRKFQQAYDELVHTNIGEKEGSYINAKR